MIVAAFVFIGAGLRVHQSYEFYLDYELTEEELAQVGSSSLQLLRVVGGLVILRVRFERRTPPR